MVLMRDLMGSGVRPVNRADLLAIVAIYVWPGGHERVRRQSSYTEEKENDNDHPDELARTLRRCSMANYVRFVAARPT